MSTGRSPALAPKRERYKAAGRGTGDQIEVIYERDPQLRLDLREDGRREQALQTTAVECQDVKRALAVSVRPVGSKCHLFGHADPPDRVIPRAGTIRAVADVSARR
jgi:hypothetical protein